MEIHAAEKQHLLNHLEQESLVHNVITGGYDDVVAGGYDDFSHSGNHGNHGNHEANANYAADLKAEQTHVDIPPLHSSDLDESFTVEKLEDGGRFDRFARVTLSWVDVSVTAKRENPKICFKSSQGPEMVDILKAVSGIVEPGQCMAIMGASGAGKTTLLNTLAFRNESKLKCSGAINVNGKEMDKDKLKMISAYVQQDDYFIGTMTVGEVMMFHANLRMDRSVQRYQKEEKVFKTLSKLGLLKVMNSLVGYPGGLVRGISGGERKRLSVATELLMDPPLLFIDEPTSGLDSFMAESVVALMGKLAKANRTILCTIHQPTSELFAMFDRVCLVSEGQIVFLGESSAGLDFFARYGMPCPFNYNPADHYIFTLAIRPGEEDACRNKCQRIIDYYKRSEDYKNVLMSIGQSMDGFGKTEINPSEIRSSTWCQVGENFKRSFLNTVRNPAYTRTRIIQTIIVGLLCGLAYYDTKNDQTAAQNKSGVLFNIVVYFTFGNVFIQTMSIPLELPVVKREYQNGMYTTVPYFLSKIFAEIPYLIGLPLVQLAICYFMIGLKKSVNAFFVSVLACVGISWASTGLGWFLSAWTGDVRIAGALTAPVIMPFFLFGGLYQNDESTPFYFLPVKYVSWIRYGFDMLMINEFEGLELDCPEHPCFFNNGTDVLTRYGIDPGTLWWPNMAALGIFGVVMCILAWVCLMFRVRR